MILKVTADSKPEYEPESRRKTVQPRAESSLSLAALATVSREWQHYFEGVTFRRVTLTPVSDTFHSLSSIVSGTRRESLVRHISIWIGLSASPMLDTKYKKRRIKDSRLRKSITWLFFCLSQWKLDTHPGLTLELCASDIQSTDAFEGWEWGLFPVAPVVTRLILPRQKTPWMDANQFRHLLAALPRLQSFRWEPLAHTTWAHASTNQWMNLFSTVNRLTKRDWHFCKEYRQRSSTSRYSPRSSVPPPTNG